MRRELRFLILTVFALASIASTSAFAVSMVSHHDWMDGYSLVLLSARDVQGFVSLRDAFQASGAQIGVAIPNRVVLGWVPPELSSRISALPGVMGVFTGPVPEALMQGMDEATLAAVRFFNSVVSGQLRAEMEKAEQARGGPDFKPLMDDGFESPGVDMNAYLNNLRAIGFDTYNEVRRLSGLGPSLATLGNSDNMVGTVTVTLFFVESDGSMDPDTYTWTTGAVSATVSSATAGLSWWASQAAAYGKSVSFTVNYFPGTDVRCQTGYEPILHSSYEARYWIEEIMGNFGYSSGSHIDRVSAYNTWARSNYGTDWAYSAFIAYNPPPASAAFIDGYAAFSYFGGPYMNVLYRSFSWPFDILFSHETGHIFWACDEYYQAGYGGCTSCGLCNSGSHNIVNGNCEYCNPQSVLCMMRDNDKVLCAFTPGQIGWLNGPIVKYYSHVIRDSSGNNNGAADPGESVKLPVTLKNWGLPVTNVTATLTTDDPYVTITSAYSTYPNMPLNGTGTSATLYTFSCSPSTPVAHVATFTLNIVGTGYDTTATFDIKIGEAPIILVDDDGGESYETYYRDALNANGYTYVNWTILTQGPPSLAELKKRKVVIWFTSQQAMATLTGTDETNLKNYLNWGGTLFFSSQDYLSERFDTFARNYLHVAEWNMDVTSTSETGVAGDAVTDGLNIVMDYPYGNYSDDIFPEPNAGAILMNSTSNPGALRYPAMGTAPYKVVFFAFPFEAIGNGAAPNNRAAVMKRVVDWLLASQDYQPPSVTVTSPNGGEEWEVGSEHQITWVASDNAAVDSVGIYYSVDGGGTFPYAVATGEINDSTFAWTVPDSPSDSCVVRIIAYDSSLNQAEDVSDSYFAIKAFTPPVPEVPQFGLAQNYPNPFNPLTRIEFSLAEEAKATLRVYDISGQLVKTLIDEMLPSGPHGVTWNAEDESGTRTASGIYVCKLEAQGKTAMRKMVLLR